LYGNTIVMSKSKIINTDREYIEGVQNILSKFVRNDETESEYVILNYDDKMLCDDDDIRRNYNGVVLNPETREILSIGIPKPYSVEMFEKRHSNMEKNDFTMENMIEGVSIQVFYDNRINKWEFSTKNSVSANYSYYRLPGDKNKTFKEMFYECIGETEKTKSIDKLEIVKKMEKSRCYHFIFQHPENHIVQNIENPRIYFMGYYELNNSDGKNQIEYVNSQDINPFECDSNIKIPPIIEYENECFSYKELMLMKDKYFDPKDMIMGVSLLHKESGDRCLVLNPQYEELKLIRGVHPNIMFHYICLRKIHKVKEFLKHFPQYKDMFWSFHKLYENLVIQMHSDYVQKYIKKTTDAINKHILFHIRELHYNIYKPSLNDTVRVIVKKDVVRTYISNLEPGCILHLLQNKNYEYDGFVQ